jgi:hypothetical protein
VKALKDRYDALMATMETMNNELSLFNSTDTSIYSGRSMAEVYKETCRIREEMEDLQRIVSEHNEFQAFLCSWNSNDNR